MTFVVAEVGSNWSCFEDAKDSIAAAKMAGADAVKFQLFTGPELYGLARDLPAGVMPRDWIPKLAEKAQACGIEFMCTAFSPDGLRYVDRYVKRHKIASSDLTYVELLQAANAAGKPVLLSTGASHPDDIRRALSYLDKVDVTLLYCVSSYPARHTDLRCIGELRKLHPKVGFSDHSTDVLEIPRSAVVEHGAIVIEKHFKLRSDMDTPDVPHSLDVSEFKDMVDSIRGRLPVRLGPTKSEEAMMLRHNRRLIATAQVTKGEALVYEKNFGCYRALKDDPGAFSPFLAQDVSGKPALRDLQPGDGIGPQEVKLR